MDPRDKASEDNSQIRELKFLFAKAKELFGNEPLSLGLVESVATQLYLLTSGKSTQRSEQVCQTILKVLDDVEKAGKVLKEESTEKENSTKVSVDDCKNFVKNHLPVILDLEKSCVASFSPWCLRRRRVLTTEPPAEAAAAPAAAPAPAPAPSSDPQVVLEPK
jgi:hypothetical protein